MESITLFYKPPLLRLLSKVSNLSLTKTLRKEEEKNQKTRAGTRQMHLIQSEACCQTLLLATELVSTRLYGTPRRCFRIMQEVSSIFVQSKSTSLQISQIQRKALIVLISHLFWLNFWEVFWNI